MSQAQAEHMSKASPAVVLATPVRRALAGRQWFGLACLGVLALSVLLNAEHPTYGIELCAMKKLTGLPCPGCGITHAIILCSRGEVAQSFHHHPLGPALWLGAVLGATSLVWPGRFCDAAARFHRRRRSAIYRCIYALTALLLVFGSLRILFTIIGAPGWWPW
jgi:hypothetical protein